MAGIEKSDSSSINYIYWNKFGWGVFFYFFGADSRSCAHSFSKRLKSRCMSYSSFVNEQSVELHDSRLESGGSVSPRDPALPARSRADSVVQTVTVHQRCASRSAHQLGVRHLEMIYPPSPFIPLTKIRALYQRDDKGMNESRYCTDLVSPSVFANCATNHPKAATLH